MELQDRLHISEITEEARNRYLTFFIDCQQFGLPITEIVQITQMQEIIAMPGQSNYIKGIINLRGQIIPIIDIRLRFGKQEAEFTERTCIIIAHVGENDVGLIVDTVGEVIDIGREQISPPPQIGIESSHVNDYLTGIAILKAGDQKEHVVLLIHAGKLLSESELFSLSKTVED